jgi:hypothetical protein
VEGVIDAAVQRYFEVRRGKVEDFVDAHFTFSGSLGLHRNALGLDLIWAPVNVALMLPTVGAKLGAMVARRVGAGRAAEWLDRRNRLLPTSVDREIEWLIYTELLELPFDDGVRRSVRDALAKEILSDPVLIRAVSGPLRVIGQHVEDPDLHERMTDILESYAGSRAAAAELAGAMINLGAGALTLNQFTPTAISLWPALAAMLAQYLAISSFPLGATLGGAWYGLFPAAPSALLVGVTTGGMIAGMSIATAFAGVLTDPVQRQFRLHQRRLWRMLDLLQRSFQGAGGQAVVAREAYVARILDLIDILRTMHRTLV